MAAQFMLILIVVERLPMKMTTTTREVAFVTIVDISGRIVLGEECTSLSNLISSLLNQGHNQILLNLADVSCIDSAGFAYLIGSLTSVRKRRGELKLLNPTKTVRSVMQLGELLTVFDVREDEAAAVKSFGESAGATA
jgi:anti-sigma B factor antagonist